MRKIDYRTGQEYEYCACGCGLRTARWRRIVPGWLRETADKLGSSRGLTVPTAVRRGHEKFLG